MNGRRCQCLDPTLPGSGIGRMPSCCLSLSTCSTLLMPSAHPHRDCSTKGCLCPSEMGPEACHGEQIKDLGEGRVERLKTYLPCSLLSRASLGRLSGSLQHSLKLAAKRLVLWIVNMTLAVS